MILVIQGSGEDRRDSRFGALEKLDLRKLLHHLASVGFQCIVAAYHHRHHFKLCLALGPNLGNDLHLTISEHLVANLLGLGPQGVNHLDAIPTGMELVSQCGRQSSPNSWFPYLQSESDRLISKISFGPKHLYFKQSA